MAVYVCPLTIPNGTLQTAPLVYELIVAEPYVIQVEIDFPSGSGPTGGNSAGVRLKHRNSQFIPSPSQLQQMASGALSSGDWITSQGDGAAPFTALDFRLNSSPETIRIEAYNTLAAAVTADVRIVTDMEPTTAQNEIVISELKRLIDKQTSLLDRLILDLRGKKP